MLPRDLESLQIASDPRLHPDGTTVAYTVSRPDLDGDRYDRSVWMAGPEEARRFTAGPGDGGARWSPDGTLLAFLRKGPGKHDRPQVAVIPVAGGDTRVVSDFALGAEEVLWSPDGSRLLVVASTWAGEWDGLDDDERARRPRRVTTYPYRFDDRGWLIDRRRQLWSIDPEGASVPRCLTPDDVDVSMPAWSPDGTRVAYLSDRDPLGGLVPGTHVWEVEVETGATSRIADRGYWAAVSYRPDGVLHLLGITGTRYPDVARLLRREPDGGLADLTEHLDRSLVSISAGAPRIGWDGDRAVVGLEDSGRMEVVGVRPDGTVDRLVEGSRVVTGFDVAAGRIAFTASDPLHPGDVFLASLGGEERCHPTGGLEGVELVEPSHFRVPSEGEELDVWVVLPPGDEPVPVLLNIHGGPASQYGFGFFDEFQVYAGAGFGVVACNPRGSSGKGVDFVRAVVGEGWGQVDLHDITVALEAALARHPRLDGDRVGIMGGSYGGFLTAWALAHDDRYRSAVIERALLSFTSFAGTSDIGGTFNLHYTEADYPEGWGAWWEKSPLSVAHRITTPTLIIHAEEDWRCPVEQAEQLWLALRRNGVDSEMLRFPGEGHEMSRSGSPRHRVERFEAIIEWHRRHLA